MTIKRLPRSVIIIGAGPAGLFTARRLRQLGVQDITILEKESAAGGKCKTFSDPNLSTLKTEYGAGALAFNYGTVVDALKEKEIALEKMLPATRAGFEIYEKLKAASWWGKIQLGASFAKQFVKFSLAVRAYNQARFQQSPLPKAYYLPFQLFAEQHGLLDINLALKPLVPGFGYGAMEVCPTYSVLEYIGYLSLPAVILNGRSSVNLLTGIQGGFQRLMLAVAADFKVITNAVTRAIERNENHVHVTFQHNGESRTLTADALVLAVPPVQCPSLGMPLTTLESACVEESFHNRYRYPVAICRVKGLAKNNIYVPTALEQQHFKHVALITTRDNRDNPTDGRLCTVYVNLPKGFNHFELQAGSTERAAMIEDLKQLPGVEAVDVLEVKIWEDYFTSISWDKRLALEQQQYSATHRTLYVGSYTLGSFEDVACVTNRAVEMLTNVFVAKQPTSMFTEVKQMWKFFKVPKVEPVGDESVPALRGVLA